MHAQGGQGRSSVALQPASSSAPAARRLPLAALTPGASLSPLAEYLLEKREEVSVSANGRPATTRAPLIESPVSGRASATLSVCRPLKRGSALLHRLDAVCLCGSGVGQVCVDYRPAKAAPGCRLASAATTRQLCPPAPAEAAALLCALT